MRIHVVTIVTNGQMYERFADLFPTMLTTNEILDMLQEPFDEDSDDDSPIDVASEPPVED